jgi:hypothetical protein
MNGSRGFLLGLVTGLAVVVSPPVRAQGPQTPAPQYLPFSEFSADESTGQRSARQTYNDAVERYNKALYDYHVTLGQVNQLADAFNQASTVTERDKAKADAAPLRVKLESLRRDATALAAAVDEARRKAAQAGVTITR